MGQNRFRVGLERLCERLLGRCGIFFVQVHGGEIYIGLDPFGIELDGLLQSLNALIQVLPDHKRFPEKRLALGAVWVQLKGQFGLLLRFVHFA